MSALEAYGRPSCLIVPSDKHRLDAKTWKDRYPEIQVSAPECARAKVEETVQVDTVAPRFDDPNVQFVTVPGTRSRESALVVRTSNGTTLVLNDVVGDIRDAAGFGGWLLHIAGFAGNEAQVPRVAKMAVIDDTKALRTQLPQWAEIESLKHILFSHGSPIDVGRHSKLQEEQHISVTGSRHCGKTAFRMDAATPAQLTHALHLLLLCQSRSTSRVLQARPDSRDVHAGRRLRLPLADVTGGAPLLRRMRLRDLQRQPGLRARRNVGRQHPPHRRQRPPVR